MNSGCIEASYYLSTASGFLYWSLAVPTSMGLPTESQIELFGVRDPGVRSDWMFVPEVCSESNSS